MSETAAPVTYKRDLPKKILTAYYIYPFFNSLSTIMALQYLTFFVTEWTGVSATLMATVYTVARFGDLFVQAISGAIMQKVKRFRPYLIILPLISQVGNFISFLNPPTSVGVKLVILTVGYCMIHFPMNFLVVAQNTMIMRVAGPNPENRMAITAANLQGTSAMRILHPQVTMPLILWCLSRNYPGYLIVMVLYGIITMLVSIMLYIATKDYETAEDVARFAAAGTAEKGPNIFQMYKLVSKNIPILVLLLSSSINTGIGNQVFTAGVQYYWRYSVGDLGMQAIAGTIAGIAAVITSFTGPWIARKIGKRNSWLFNNSWQLLVYFGIMFWGDGNPWVYIWLTSIQTLSTSVTTAWGIQLWLDAAEVQLYETGVDTRSFTMSMNNYPIKLGFIISGPFVAWMLNHSGYSAADGIGSIADTGLFMRNWLIIPIIGMILSFINIFIGYRVDEQYAKDCAAANAKAAAERVEAEKAQNATAPANS
ncbi:MAG: MFS transporter [Oscillospiraceae bacterium]|nr:MFS transporter [Oscillospiraceae bacterium]